MIKTLIIDDNLQYSKNILNNILSRFKDIQVLYIASTYQEGIDIILKNQVDLIFLDLKLPDYNGFKIIEDLKYVDCLKKPRIIIVSGDSELLEQAIKSNNVCEIIRKIDDYESIYEKIGNIVNDIRYEINHKKVEESIFMEIFRIPSFSPRLRARMRCGLIYFTCSL